MADTEKWEILALQQEFDWVLQHEVPAAVKQLRTVVEECARHFPLSVGKIVTPPKLEKFVMATASHNAQDSIKCIVTVLGDNITNADINIKLHKNTSQYHGQLQTEWKLQQTQDSANHLQSCCYYLENLDDGTVKSADEALHALNTVQSFLSKGRNALIIPKKRTIDDLVSSRNMKSLIPNLPSDLTVSFYIQAHKLIFAVYLLSQTQGHVKFDTFQAECSVPWLSEVIALFSDALQLCQQLKDKVGVWLIEILKNYSLAREPRLFEIFFMLPLYCYCTDHCFLPIQRCKLTWLEVYISGLVIDHCLMMNRVRKFPTAASTPSSSTSSS